jgi:hypothetical protein
MKFVYIGENQTLNHFMINDFSMTRRKLKEFLKDICEGAPFDNEYLLGHDWCYSEYSTLLEKNNITLKVRKGTLDYKFFTKFILNFSLGYIVIDIVMRVFQAIF